jgi:phosphoribosylglycinamide formyltransferase 1
MSARKRVAILISGRGSNMGALIEAAAEADFPAEIALVLSNRPDAKGLEFAAAHGIATAIVDHRAYPTREDFEDALAARLADAHINIVCLAGFLRMFTASFVEPWRGRMLNIHPSLLPEFKGLDTHARALAANAKIHGCTVHFVVPELDSGPTVLQARVPVVEGDDADSLAERVLAAEHRIYPVALKLVAEGKVTIDAPAAGAPAKPR